jgi:hypothetical protein
MATMPVSERLTTTRVRLLALYAAALEVSAGGGDDVEALPSPDVPEIGGFEDHDLYWEVFDPYENSDPVCGLLVVVPNVLPPKCASAAVEADAGCHG